jgi:hypothetical protein
MNNGSPDVNLEASPGYWPFWGNKASYKDCCQNSALASLLAGTYFLNLSKKIIEHGDRT